jgi:GT2 family glycosyltransferase
MQLTDTSVEASSRGQNSYNSSKPKKIGIVTVTYNSADVLPRFLDCVLAQRYPEFVLYVVDNNSSDSTIAIAEQISDRRLVLIKNSKNCGFADGSNKGIQAALRDGCGEILLLNNDTEFGTELLGILSDALRQYNCGMVTPKILCGASGDRIWSAGGGFAPWLGYRIFIRGQGSTDRRQYDKPEQQDFAPGCCWMIRENVFQTIGLLDPEYFVYGEDVDFLYRAKQAGIEMFYQPAVTVMHKAGSLTGGKGSRFVVRYATRNRVLFVLKHQPVWFSAIFAIAYFTYILLTAFTGGHRIRRFPTKFKAFFEGLGMGVSARRHRLENRTTSGS